MFAVCDAPLLAECRAGNLLIGKDRTLVQDLYESEHINDGAIVPDGTAWDSTGVTLFESSSGLAVLDLGEITKLSSAFVQGDNNDWYTLYGSLDGSTWSQIAAAGPMPDAGLRLRTLRFSPIEARFIRVTASGGDGIYSISEIGVGCGDIPPWESVPRIESRSQFLTSVQRINGGAWRWIFVAIGLLCVVTVSLFLYGGRVTSQVRLRSVLQQYCTFDLRSLALFRIVFALSLLVDLYQRASVRELFYYPEGLYPPSLALRGTSFPFPMTIFHFIESPLAVDIVFIAAFISYLSLLVGYRTKLAQVAAFIFVTSLHEALIFGHSGHRVLRILALLTLWLPLNRFFSLDSYHAKRDYSCSSHRTPLAVLLLLQITIIYFFNVLHKFSPEWLHGSFLPLILWDDSIVTSLGIGARDGSPLWFLRLCTHLTLLVEAIGAVFLLSPIGTSRVREMAILLLIPLHIGIGLFMQVPSFSCAMVAFLVLFLPDLSWRRLNLHLPHNGPDVQSKGHLWFRYIRTPAEYLFASSFLIAFVVQTIRDNEPLQSVFRFQIPPVLSRTIDLGRYRQNWCMFASCGQFSNIPAYATILTETETLKGTRIDVLRSAFSHKIVAASPTAQERPQVIQSELWHLYLGVLLGQSAPVKEQFLRWLRQYIDSNSQALGLSAGANASVFVRAEPFYDGHSSQPTNRFVYVKPL